MDSIINAAGALSRLGGSTLSDGVRFAMNEAARDFVEIPILHDRVGEELARLTNNEAVCVSSGAAAGVLISVAACVAGDDVKRAEKLPNSSAILKSDVVVWKEHLTGVLAGADQVLENGYLSAVPMVGGTLRAISDPEQITRDTACVLWFPKVYPHIVDEEGIFDRFISRARDMKVPVIVDAADQIPPISNLWYYTREKGADLAIFSGGKGLQGPGASGLVVGRKDLVKACRTHSGPEHSVGRPAKVGKEELVGILQAVREAVELDPVVESERFNEYVTYWRDCFRILDSLGIATQISSTSHSGQPIPRTILVMPGGDREIRDAIIERLWNGNPRIAVLPEEHGAIALNPHMVRQEEREIIVQRVIEGIKDELQASSTRQ
jgi:L-seryl-tRNA(Ser) seleniumtransferase